MADIMFAMAIQKFWYTTEGATLGFLDTDGKWFYKPSGEPLAYIQGKSIYSPSGEVLGHFDNSRMWIYSEAGKRLGYLYTKQEG